jgi:hypothetical protein
VVLFGLLAGLVWCLLLFGIGLDDLLDKRMTPGVILSVVLLVVLVPAFVYGIWRASRPVLRRLARN